MTTNANGTGSEPSRADEFLELYNQADSHLRQIVHPDHYVGFSTLIDMAAVRDSAVRNVQMTLKAYGRLRNAIIHAQEYPLKIIADPHEDAVQDFAQIVKLVTSPPKLFPTFAVDLHVFAVDEPLVKALVEMRRRDYSQIVVEGDSGVELLTTEGIARWLEQRSEAESVGVREATIRDVVTAETVGSFVVMRHDATVFDAEDAFAQFPAADVSRLYAIIITQNGSRTEKPLGIVTPWDLLAYANGNSG